MTHSARGISVLSERCVCDILAFLFAMLENSDLVPNCYTDRKPEHGLELLSQYISLLSMWNITMPLLGKVAGSDLLSQKEMS